MQHVSFPWPQVVAAHDRNSFGRAKRNSGSYCLYMNYTFHTINLTKRSDKILKNHKNSLQTVQKTISDQNRICCNSMADKTRFIIPADAHYHKSVDMLKQFKAITLASTCFGSRRNHHQGVFLCLAKTTYMGFFCACR
jgi:hypothetical protein